MSAGSSDLPRPQDPARIVAHRGASGAAPENTIAAFRLAARQGVRWVEFDVSLLGDGTPVLHHDATLDRCTDASGPLSRLKAADLAGMDAGGWFGPDHAGEPLPTLAAALDALEALGLSANLELKPHDRPPGALAAAVARELAGRPRWRSAMTVSSFNHRELAVFRDRMPEMPLALLCETPARDWREAAAALRAEAIHPDHKRIGPDFVAAAREAGLAVRVYTVNNPDRVVALRDAGLDAVITDHPPRYLSDPVWSRWAAD